MLILVRKVQQSIWIEGDIHIKVLSVERDRVKLAQEIRDDLISPDAARKVYGADG